jgi:hypothetical protein
MNLDDKAAITADLLDIVRPLVTAGADRAALRALFEDALDAAAAMQKLDAQRSPAPRGTTPKTYKPYKPNTHL